MSGFKSLVSKFEPPPGSEKPPGSDKLPRVASGDRKLALDADPEDLSALSKTPPGTPVWQYHSATYFTTYYICCIFATHTLPSHLPYTALYFLALLIS
jgi:hypothetical protein